MRESEMWRRLGEAVGESYAPTWAESMVIAELGGRTVREAIDAGIPFVQIWRAVWSFLDLPARER